MSHLNDIIKPSFSADPYPTIKVGSKGDVVKTWQKIVGVTEDGSFGLTTELATKGWQKSHGLKEDGIVGPNTWNVAQGGSVPQKVSATQAVASIGIWEKIKALPLWIKVASGAFLGGMFLLTAKRK